MPDNQHPASQPAIAMNTVTTTSPPAANTVGLRLSVESEQSVPA
jgi:hypothetical protein